MSHTKESITKNTQAVIAALDHQIKLYQGAIAALQKAVHECNNARTAVTMLATSADEVPVELTQVAPGPSSQGRPTHSSFIKQLSEKISAAGNGQ
jgi:hypothetical protein